MGKLHFFPKNHMEKLHFFPKRRADGPSLHGCPIATPLLIDIFAEAPSQDMVCISD